MTDQEIDRWVEEHIKVPPKEELNEHTTVVYPKLIPAVIEWGKVIAHKFYELGKQSKEKEYSFKPTQEQLNALDTVYKTHGADSACRHVILNLLNQLKEL